MSRTYRNIRHRQNYGNGLDWILESSFNSIEDIPFNDIDHIEIRTSFRWWVNTRYDVRYKKDSKEGKRRLARYFSDAGTHNFKEPGPSWFRNVFSQRPLRRKAKRELQKFMLDEEYEPMIDTKPPLPYWT